MQLMAWPSLLVFDPDTVYTINDFSGLRGAIFYESVGNLHPCGEIDTECPIAQTLGGGFFHVRFNALYYV